MTEWLNGALENWNTGEPKFYNSRFLHTWCTEALVLMMNCAPLAVVFCMQIFALNQAVELISEHPSSSAHLWPCTAAQMQNWQRPHSLWRTGHSMSLQHTADMYLMEHAHISRPG